MGAWEAIKYVGSGLGLAAFCVAAALFAYRAWLDGRAKIIQSARHEERVEAVAVSAQFFRVDTSRLSAKQQEATVLTQLRLRARRDLLLGIFATLVTFMMAAVVTVAILRESSQGSSSAEHKVDQNATPFQALPTPEQFESAAKVCAAGSSINLNVDTLRSVKNAYADIYRSGSFKEITAQKFLEDVPPEDKLEAFRLYTTCITSILGIVKK